MYQIQFMPAIGSEWLLAREVPRLPTDFSVSDAQAVVAVSPEESVVRVLAGRVPAGSPAVRWLPKASARMPAAPVTVADLASGRVHPGPLRGQRR